ncbi:MAG: transcription-repair coupling factor [Clostridia bacterium]|nr:transcription-repair coupling factor [Clostridia bacterium]
MKIISQALREYAEYQDLLSSVGMKRYPIGISGTAHIHKANIINTLCIDNKCGAFVLCGDENEAARMVQDLTEMGQKPLHFGSRQLSFHSFEGVSHEFEQQRIDTLSAICRDDEPKIVVACADSALLHTIPKEKLKALTGTYKLGETTNLNEICARLVSNGYARAGQVDGIGQFSVRGGIIDFFAPGFSQPFRIELWGDEIDSISFFDPDTQRRTDSTDQATVTPASEVLFDSLGTLTEKLRAVAASQRGKRAAAVKEKLYADIQQIESTGAFPSSIDRYLPLAYENPVTLFDYIGENDILFISEPSHVRDRLKGSLTLLGETVASLLENGILSKEMTSFSEGYDYLQSICGKRGVFLDSFARSAYDVPVKELFSFNMRQLSPWSGNVALLKDDITGSAVQNRAVVVLAGTAKSARILADDLRDDGINALYAVDPDRLNFGAVTVMPGKLNYGFDYPNAYFTLITQGNVSSERSRKRQKPKHAGQALRSLEQLSVGDYVVHSTHGIGIYSGISKINTQGIVKDYIKISYAKGDVLYVPVTQLDLVSKYIGAGEDGAVRINRLGSDNWQRAKSRVRSAVKDMAKELTKLYSQRMSIKGIAFSEDSEWQKDFECRFPYEETDDQLRCIDEIKQDMQRTVPMDRLLCGDVGFGKTEVALRAAFKCVLESKQCAILVPTTILAWQHYQTILQRMEGFPVRVEMLSRFRSQRQQAEIIEKLRRGEIDIIVGTHRIIQKDIKFKSLGLLIVDEEQRFGVAHKERLKELYPTVDCLTLSATPIPRTLNMAMSGMRDISIIEEAPMDRRPVQTYVLEYDRWVIEEAIRRELSRGGQVYYLHNRVETIDRCAAKIQQMCPEARIGIAHGKMSEEELSDIWRELLDGEIDILVCTTIIETGVDVPNCNTLIIENADRFGLSQLHQIRGRVGRSSRMAYAYMTFVKGKALSEVSTKRLTAIRDFTEFGSGFHIAMRDLEIRGAGNVLGSQQHGHMDAVGYEMYIRLLNEAVKEEKGESRDEMFEPECLVDVQIEAHIPEDYIESSNHRLEIYKRIADIRTKDDASDVLDELIDRFGDPPDSVYGLIEIASLRNLAASLGVNEISQNNDTLLFYMKKFDLQTVSQLSSLMKSRVYINAGAKPHIAARIRNGQRSIDCMHEVLNLMKGLSGGKRNPSE